jgi:hypothetical protein
LNPAGMAARLSGGYWSYPVAITRIVCGFQTGADRGGADAGLFCSTPVGGWVPRGRRAEDGTIPAKYDCKETVSEEYLPRTEANVVDSDATLVFTVGALTGGSRMTVEFAVKHHRPHLHVDLAALSREQCVERVVQWLGFKCPASCALNVAGSRESKSPGIHDLVQSRMVDVICRVNGKMFYPLPEPPGPQTSARST